MDNNVNIPREEYNALYYNNGITELLINALKSAAKLDYYGTGIAFDERYLDCAFKTLLPDTYNEVLTKLQADKEFEKEF